MSNGKGKQALLCRLQNVQNNAARVMIGSKKYDHITPILKDLHWLPIRKRIEFKILLLSFQCMQGCAPLYLRELLVKQANTRTLRSNTKNLLQIPHTNLKRFGDSREIHPLEPQRHRHSMLVPRVCAPRVTRCSLGHVIWSVQLACSILSRSDSCQGYGRQRHLRMQAQYPLPVYYSQVTARAFCVYAPPLWNELPDNIKAADSVQNFKTQLKTLLIQKEFIWQHGP